MSQGHPSPGQSEPSSSARIPEFAVLAVSLAGLVVAAVFAALPLLAGSAAGPPPSVAIAAAASGNAATGLSNEPDTPAADEAGGVQSDLLETLASAAERRGGLLDDPSLEMFLNRDESGSTTDGSGVIPPSKRWRIVFPEGITERQYARQLDLLGIELGVLTDDGQIAYVSKVALPDPVTRTAPRSAETRLYMSWNRGDLAEADRVLLANAGIPAAGKITLHFYPAPVEAKLAELEKSHQGRDPAEILLTRFGVRDTAQSVEFYVLEQIPRE